MYSALSGECYYMQCKALADADLYRLNYRKYGKYEDFKQWKSCVKYAWEYRKYFKRYAQAQLQDMEYETLD